VGKVPQHDAEGHVNLVDVEAVVARILVLMLHHSNHGEGSVGNIEGLPNGRASGKQLLVRLAAQEGHAASLRLVVPVVKAPLRHVDAANLGEAGKRTGDNE